MHSFKELHESIKKGEEFYTFSLEKAKEKSKGDPKKFTKLAASFTGNSKPKIKTCCIFQKILEELIDK